jgi:hypothetical protein
MHKYIIERTIPGAGKLGTAELSGIASKSNAVLSELGHGVQWVQSWVTDDKVFCLYYSATAELVREHARRGGIPVDSIHEVRTIIDPTTDAPR